MLRGGQPMTFGQQAKLAGIMSMPAILAQLSSVLMQFIDSAMVGNLGVNAAASVGLMSTCTWLFGGFCSAAAAGFSVQAAHLIGAKDFAGARKILRQGITALLTFSVIVALTGICISHSLPGWLGGADEIRHDAGMYFMIVMAGLPAVQFEFFGAGMLQSCGNMKIPSIMSIIMCVLDICFNFMLIYPTRTLTLGGIDLTVPGAGLGVEGAALGTVMAECCTVGVLMYYIVVRSKELSIFKRGERGSFRPTRVCINNALTISLPMTMQNIIMRGAQCAQHHHCRTAWNHIHCGQCVCNYRREFLLHAGLRNCRCRYISCRTEPRSQETRPRERFCTYYRRTWHGRDGPHGRDNVCAGPAIHRAHVQ